MGFLGWRPEGRSTVSAHRGGPAVTAAPTTDVRSGAMARIRIRITERTVSAVESPLHENWFRETIGRLAGYRAVS